MVRRCKSASSVAVTYKPPMLVPRVRLPAGALSFFFVSTQTAMATQRQHQQKGNASATRAIFDVYVRQAASTAALTGFLCFHDALLLHSDQAFWGHGDVQNNSNQGQHKGHTRATQTARATQRQHQHKGNARATRQHLMFLIENGQAIHSDHAFWGYVDVQNNVESRATQGPTQGRHKQKWRHKGNTSTKEMQGQQTQYLMCMATKRPGDAKAPAMQQ